MPLFYQQDINQSTQWALWKIEESLQDFKLPVALPSNITHPNKQLQHAAGRHLLGFLKKDFSYTSLEAPLHGKPYVQDGSCEFSISHAQYWATAIVSNEPVGIDVETYTPRVFKIAHKFIHPSEKIWIDELLANNSIWTALQLHIFLWSAKEALYKWWGKGALDFIRDMQVEAPQQFPEGRVGASLHTEGQTFHLQLHYKAFSDCMLVWTKAIC
ncbi:MAG: 4'-phosphopantetheinyl transferase superfamily protein [Hydrotalea sp.]|nr:4'-phosphopantetheinyl transferase superfamily protein [Hydrotalea sp.]